MQPFHSGSIRPGNVLDHWHLLSFDAPTVAIVWSFAFAHCAHVHLRWLPCAMLGIATWLLYVADRLLDGSQASITSPLRERHYYHRRHRTAFIVAAIPACVLLAWFVAERMRPAVRHEDLILCACALLYLLCVHLPLSAGKRGIPHLPKEMIVGIIFAAACVIPAWSANPPARPALLFPVILFAALCFLNCTAIEHWEKSVTTVNSSNSISPWIGNKLSSAFLFLASAAVAAGVVAQRPLYPLTLSICLSALLLLGLNRSHRRLDPLRLRALADAALLTPAIFLLLSHRVS